MTCRGIPIKTDPINWRAFELAAWRRLPPPLRKRAVAWLREQLSDEVVAQVRQAADADPEWCASYHFGWGMGIRNLLRDKIADTELPPSPEGQINAGDRNWDDYYVAVVEVACRGGVWHELPPAERE